MIILCIGHDRACMIRLIFLFLMIIVLACLVGWYCFVSGSTRTVMPRFSSVSFTRLSTCHIDLQVLFFDIVRNFDCTILEGYRNKVDQEKAFDSGHSKLHYPHGNHNKTPSNAVDVTPYPIDFGNDKLAIWFGAYVLGVAQKLKDEGKMTHSIRWGGSWSGLGILNTPDMLQDLDHFEIIE